MKVAAVIPHWNRRELLGKLLESMGRQTRPFDEVIVADNGSTDGSAEMAEKAGARVLRLGSNLGFAAAVNRGIAAAQSKGEPSEWIAILNNDVTLEPDWLETLVTAGGHNDVWFACGKVLRARNPCIIDATFDEISRAACAWRCGSGRADSPVWNQPWTIRIAPMTAALFRSGLFKDIGLLDESFESYLEDVDFGLRCAFAGRAGVYVPQAVSHHVGSATAGEWNKDTVRRIARNQVLLAKKHFSGMPVWRIVAGQLLWGLVAFRNGRAFSYLQGKAQGLFASCGRSTWAGKIGYRHEFSPRPISRMEGVEDGGDSSQSPFFRRKVAGGVLEASERQIFDLQEKTGFDRYWRAYFWLSRR